MDLDWLNAKIGKNNYKALETRGGYHLLVEPKKATAFRKKQFDDNKWHQLISKKYPVDQSGDQLLPVPGTFQGGFIPFLEIRSLCCQRSDRSLCSLSAVGFEMFF